MKNYISNTLKRKSQKLSFMPKAKSEFGGSLLKGKRKEKRPLSFTKPMHFVFKSANAMNHFAFVTHQKDIIEIMNNISRRYGIKLYELAVNFNHIHLVIKLNSSSQYKSWIRHLTSAIVALLVTKAKSTWTQFFTLRPYSRILTWGREFKVVLEYLYINQLEVVGLRPAKNRLTFALSFRSRF